MPRKILLVLALMLGALPALAQAPRPSAPPPAAAPAAPAAPARTWTVACADRPAGQARECRLSATAVLQPQNQRLLTVLLVRQPETRSLALVFQVPHGAALQAGLTWQVDEGEAQRLPFQSSDPEGLYAGIPVADDLLAALRRATMLRVSFAVLGRREAVTVAVAMSQFGEAAAEFFAAEQPVPR